MIIAIDFDGTIVEYDFPRIGELKPNAAKVMTRLYSEGHSIIIWTCRTSQNQFKDIDLSQPTIFDVWTFLAIKGIPFTTINHNCPGNSFQPSPKVYADIYIDDRQLGGIPDDWEDIYKLIKKQEAKWQ